MSALTQSRLISRFSKEVKLSHSRGEAAVDVLIGELSIVASLEEANIIRPSIEHLSVVSSGLITPEGATGLLSFLGVPGRLAARVSGRAIGSWYLEGSIAATALYRAVEEKRGFRRVEDRLVPHFERFSGTVKGVLVRDGDRQFVFEDGSLEVQYKGGGLGWIRELSISLRGARVLMSPPGGSRFTLAVRAIGFKESKSDPNPSGKSAWESQLQRAKDVWADCGIDLDIQNFREIVDKTRKLSLDPLVVRGSSDPELKTVEVYYTASDLADGGGYAISCGSALATVVVSEKQAANVNLVAHEIGHIFCGVHPLDTPAVGEWKGDAGSVLEPGGGPGHAGSTGCEHASNASLAIIKS